MASSEYTSQAVASLAGRVLRGYKPTTREIMILAATALTQRADKADKADKAHKAKKKAKRVRKAP